ncbi:hypothetical protein K402DRAFT_340566 [Aulographum hederae CBS 113979]|uniref:Ubiquitin-like-conjugating enzyme ATG10 n=1 Tax=Aulographum hederae CBS 113979 TaxID=1176131 RepID=A0A6G1GNG0_9PEZI|nr:hypothetical protein K402DRAFT_340566 [Aulographum hederae CBS 113979]
MKEAIHVASVSQVSTIEYDILLSPTYQVPVLCFTARKPDNRPFSTEEIYSFVVPQSFKAQARDVGVMGAISVTDHPISGMPVHFVHPCLTSEALSKCASGSPVQIKDCLFLWLGIVGGCVGLHAPLPQT